MIEINGNEYQSKKMAPREQFHVFRRIAPLLAPVGPAIAALLEGDMKKEDFMKNVAATVGPFAEALSTLPDEQLDFVLDHCLANVERKDASAGTWHPIYVMQPRGAIRMYQDIDMANELRLVAEVVKVNLTGFFGQLNGGAAPSFSAQTSEAPGARRKR